MMNRRMFLATPGLGLLPEADSDPTEGLEVQPPLVMGADDILVVRLEGGLPDSDVDMFGEVYRSLLGPNVLVVRGVAGHTVIRKPPNA